MIGGIYWQLGSANGGGGGVSAEIANRSYTAEEMAGYDGKDGNECLVAVDGDVYFT